MLQKFKKVSLMLSHVKILSFKTDHFQVEELNLW